MASSSFLIFWPLNLHFQNLFLCLQIHLIIMVIIVLATALQNKQWVVQSKFFFPHVSFLTELWHRHILIYSMSTDLLVKKLFLIVAICGMIVACMNLCINEAMRRWAAYRLAWDQRMERDRLQRSDNIIRVTVVWLWHQRSNLYWLGSIYPRGNEFNICWETNESAHGVSAMHPQTFEVCPWSNSNAHPNTWWGLTGWPSHLHGKHPLNLWALHGWQPYFYPKKFDTYLNF